MGGLHIVLFTIICSFQTFRTLFRILSLKPAGGGGVLAYIRRSASQRSESMNVFMWFIFASFYLLSSAFSNASLIVSRLNPENDIVFSPSGV